MLSKKKFPEVLYRLLTTVFTSASVRRACDPCQCQRLRQVRPTEYWGGRSPGPIFENGSWWFGCPFLLTLFFAKHNRMSLDGEFAIQCKRQVPSGTHRFIQVHSGTHRVIQVRVTRHQNSPRKTHHTVHRKSWSNLCHWCPHC